MQNNLDIDNRPKEVKDIYDIIERIEFGIRAVCVMYDEHSEDKLSHDNIYRHKDNVYYRLHSARVAYNSMLREIGEAEHTLLKVSKGDPRYYDRFIMGNPYFKRMEMDVSSHYDNLIFQLASAFDYLSHVICYICKRNKADTLYWTKLAKACRGAGNELSKLELKKCVIDLDKEFVGRLYDYRSRLFHHQRDVHQFESYVYFEPVEFRVTIKPSQYALRSFRQLLQEIEPTKEVTLAYMSSMLIKRSVTSIEMILDALVKEILKVSFLRQNIDTPKGGKSFVLMMYDKNSMRASPVSQHMWKRYKEGFSH